MRLLVVQPGASYSTHDVFVGLSNALLARGHEVHVYNLDRRIDRSHAWLHYLWRKAGKPDPRPTDDDTIYHASWEVVERALRFKVDGVLAISAMLLHPVQMMNLRTAGIRTGVVFTESPYDDGNQVLMAPHVDVCWTNERRSVRLLRQANQNVHYLPAAYNPEQHRFLDEMPSETVPAHDVVFVGSGFPERVELLRAVDWTGIDLGLYGAWPLLGSRNKLRKYLRGNVVDNRYAVDLYRRAKIGLNVYRVGDGDSLNPRAYELAACGVFQVSSRRREVVERFGYSVPMFRDATELEGLIREYLPLEKARRAAAQAARHQVEPHTFAARAEQIDAQLTQAWAVPIAKGA